MQPYSHPHPSPSFFGGNLGFFSFGESPGRSAQPVLCRSLGHHHVIKWGPFLLSASPDGRRGSAPLKGPSRDAPGAGGALAARGGDCFRGWCGGVSSAALRVSDLSETIQTVAFKKKSDFSCPLSRHSGKFILFSGRLSAINLGRNKQGKYLFCLFFLDFCTGLFAI